MNLPKYFTLLENSAAYKALQKSVEDNALAQAYIFVSPDFTSLKLLSRLFAASAITNNNLEDEDSTAELIFKDMHADVKIFPSANGKSENTVYTADIDELLSTVNIRPSSGDKKFYIIDYGETMNSSCQNKLLKTLEEPPASVHIIINCASLAPILPTIISRCRKIEPDNYSDKQLYDYFGSRSLDDKKLDLAISLSRGSLTIVDKIINDNKYQQLFENAINILLTLQSSKNILECASKLLINKERLSDYLEFFVIILRDVLMLLSSKRELISLKNYSSDIESLSQMYSISAILKIFPSISHALERIKGFGNFNSIVDELLMAIASDKAKYKNG